MNLPNFLTQWPNGEIVITGHRIGLYSLIDLVESGRSPDEIRDELPSLDLELIRRVIAFREAHRPEVDTYVAEYRADLERQESASNPSPALLRIRRLIAERAASGQSSADS